MGSLVGKTAAGQPRSGRAAFGVRRHLRQRLLGSGPGHRDATAGCSWRWGPKLAVPLTHWDGDIFTFSMVTRELAARQRSPRRRSTATR